MPNFSVMNAACVPLPAPGGPSRINRMNTSLNMLSNFFLMRQCSKFYTAAVSGAWTAAMKPMHSRVWQQSNRTADQAVRRVVHPPAMEEKMRAMAWACRCDTGFEDDL